MGLYAYRLIYCCMSGESSWPASNETRMCSDIRIPALQAGYLQDGAITVLGYQKALCHVSIKDILGLQLSERFRNAFEMPSGSGWETSGVMTRAQEGVL